MRLRIRVHGGCTLILFVLLSYMPGLGCFLCVCVCFCVVRWPDDNQLTALGFADPLQSQSRGQPKSIHQHCEFVADQTVPDGWGQVTSDGNGLAAAAAMGGGSSDVGAIVGGVVGGVLAVVAVLAAAVWYRRLRLSEPHAAEAGAGGAAKLSDLNLDPDGGTLRDDDYDDNNNRHGASIDNRGSGGDKPAPSEDGSVEPTDVI